jgi:hypothetical protein
MWSIYVLVSAILKYMSDRTESVDKTVETVDCRIQCVHSALILTNFIFFHSFTLNTGGKARRKGNARKTKTLVGGQC